MKSILMSIKPKWVEKILNGEKTMEIRKVAPKIKEPFKVYLYCTKAKDKEDKQIINTNWSFVRGREQKIIGEFICEKVLNYECSSEGFGELATTCGTCLTYDDILNYCGGQDLYGLYISQLKIYDNPKELSEFRNICESCDTGKKCDECKYFVNRQCYEDDVTYCYCDGLKPIIRPPQNYCYVEDLGE